MPKGRVRPLAASKKAPTTAGVAAALAKPLANPKLAQFSGIVIDPATGKTLWKLGTGAARRTSVDPNSGLTT